MSNNGLKEILDKIRENRQTAELQLKERKEAIYEQIPKLMELERLMNTKAADYSLALLKEPDRHQEIMSAMQKTLDDLKTERAFLLTENNIPLNFFEPNYSCKICKDTGHTENGEFCHCVKQQLIEKNYKMTHIRRKLEKENFSTFRLDVYPNEQWPKESVTPRENMRYIVSLCESFVHNFSADNSENLLFYGEAGLGKTFLCNSIAKALLDKSFSVLYQTPFTILDIIEQKKFTRNPDSSITEAYDMLFSSDLLIIDDLGSSLSNSLVVSELFNIINQRLISGGKMVISMNMGPHQLSTEFSERIASRIFGNFNMIKFYGPDIRIISRK